MKLGYVLLYVADVPATLAFYEAAFGLTRKLLHEDGYAELDTGSTTLGFVSEAVAKTHAVEIGEAGSDRPAPPFEIALVTEELDAAYRRALENGAVAVSPPTEKPWGQTVSYVRDLNGFLVELCTPVKAPEA